MVLVRTPGLDSLRCTFGRHGGRAGVTFGLSSGTLTSGIRCKRSCCCKIFTWHQLLACSALSRNDMSVTSLILALTWPPRPVSTPYTLLSGSSGTPQARFQGPRGRPLGGCIIGRPHCCRVSINDDPLSRRPVPLPAGPWPGLTQPCELDQRHVPTANLGHDSWAFRLQTPSSYYLRNIIATYFMHE